MASYPSRPPFFAHRFVRVLHKSCAAQDIGPAACYLLAIIAHTEDAARYAGPARFWNSQLSETMGFRSPQQLVRERARAVDAGWLVYKRGGTRAVGEYFVTIPARFQGLSDAPIEPTEEGENHSDIHSENGTNRNDRNGVFVPESERECDGSVTEPGTLPIPSPFPFPNTSRRRIADEQKASPGRTSKPRKEAPAWTPEDRATAESIWRDIVARQPTRKPPNLDQWADEIRLMRERDKRPHAAVLALWRRVQADSFWRDNVLSPTKLRERWDDLELKLGRGPSRNPSRVHTGRYDNAPDRY